MTRVVAHLPYLNLDIKYYDLGLESRDALHSRPPTRVTPCADTPAFGSSPDQRPDHDRLRRGHPKVQRRVRLTIQPYQSDVVKPGTGQSTISSHALHHLGILPLFVCRNSHGAWCRRRARQRIPKMPTPDCPLV